MLSSEMLVADLLARYPLVMTLFIELHLNCIGCSLNKFCTLDDICTHYELDFETLVLKIQKKYNSR